MIKQWMRNKRKHSVRCGYLPKRDARRAELDENRPPGKRRRVGQEPATAAPGFALDPRLAEGGEDEIEEELADEDSFN